MVKKRPPSKHSKSPYLLSVVVVLLVIGAVYTYHLANKKKPIPTVNQYTKGQVNYPVTSSNPSKTTSSPSSPTKTGAASGPLVAPTGNFVSDHHPNLGGSPAPNSMTSVCNTSPGASCKIWFTNGSTTKSLPAQVTDAGGTTYWYWKLQDIGLTAGSWKVSAISSMGSNSLSSTDPAALVVSQ